jgi:hypothetical protein
VHDGPGSRHRHVAIALGADKRHVDARVASELRDLLGREVGEEREGAVPLQPLEQQRPAPKRPSAATVVTMTTVMPSTSRASSARARPRALASTGAALRLRRLPAPRAPRVGRLAARHRAPERADRRADPFSALFEHAALLVELLGSSAVDRAFGNPRQFLSAACSSFSVCCSSFATPRSPITCA